MTARKLYFIVALIFPLFTLFFMATIFGNGLIEDIPVAVVDLDNSQTSRSIARTIDVTPTFNVVGNYSDEATARTATQRKEIYGYMVIPKNFEYDLINGFNPTLPYYYHYALLSVGSKVRAGFETTLRPLSAAPMVVTAEQLAIPREDIVSFISPFSSQNHPINNPQLDYDTYLCFPIFFIMFQVLILLVTVYVIGSEMRFGTSDEWLECANGNILSAVLGKLLPYCLIFITIGIFANYIFFGVLNIPFKGDFWGLNLTVIQFVLSTQALALIIYSLFPAFAVIISIVSMIGSLGATLSGVTFPVATMYPLFEWFSYLLPIRHFVEISQQLLGGSYTFATSWVNAAAMLVFVLLAFMLLPHLRKAIQSHRYDLIH